MNKLIQFGLGLAVGVTGALLLGADNLGMSAAMGVALILIGVVMLVRKRNRNGAVGAILIPSLLALPMNAKAAEQEQPIKPAAGAVVIGVGIGLLVGCGYICYRAIDQCEKNKKKIPPPPPPRNPNTETNGISLWLGAAPGEDDCDSYSGYYNYLTDYCSIMSESLAASDSSQKFHGVTIAITMGYDGVAKVDGITHHSDGELISHDEEMAAIQRDYGINWNAHGGDYQTTKNGQSIDRDAVPFIINQSPFDPKVTIYPDRPQHEFVIDMSTDGTTYSRMAHVSMPAGQKFLFQDVRDSAQAFYRVTSL